MDPKKKTELQEKASDGVGGGATGVSKVADPTGVVAKKPGPSKDQGELASQKVDGEVQDTDPETNTKATADTSAQNKASVSMKEDMDKMFEGEDLSEEFKEKATTFFEAAVHAKLQEHVAKLEEQFEQKLTEEVEAIAEDLVGKIDDYMDYVVKEWMEENSVAIESSLRTQVTEEFIGGLKSLFQEHYLDIPDEKVDVVESLAAEVDELQAKLNESIEKQIQLTKQIDEQSKHLIFSEVSEGLADTQADKFKTLAEGVEFSDAATFKKKLETLKESYFSTKSTSTQLIVESEIEAAEMVEPPAVVPAAVARYVSAITRTSKK